jgi:hypothetical protein
MELLKKEARMGNWGTSKGIRLSKPILEVMDFTSDDVEMTIRLTDEGKKELVITGVEIDEEEYDNYSEEELKLIGLKLDRAEEDYYAGRIYTVEEAMEWLARGKDD